MVPRLNVPPVTRGLLVAIFVLSFLYNYARWSGVGSYTGAVSMRSPPVPALTLVPSQSLFYPWTLLTTTFVERNIVSLALNAATVFFGGRYLERAWGSKGFGIVIMVAAIIPNVLIVPTYMLWSGIVGNSARADAPITGGITIQAAFLVAFKQLVPEHTVSVFRGFIKMRVKHFPAIYLLLNTISGLVFGSVTSALLAWVGLVTSWIYLRFYKTQPDLSGISTGAAALVGDASETFAFATFFPEVMQPPIAAVCDQIFNGLSTLKLCTPFSDEAIASGNEQAAARGEAGLPSLLHQSRSARGQGKREEAERRRALALKALDQRLTNASSSRAATASVTVASAPAPLESTAVPALPGRPEEAQ